MFRRPTLAAVLAAFALVLVAGGRPAGADDAPPKIRAVNPTSAPRGTQVDVTIEGTNMGRIDDVECSRTDVGVVKQSGGSDYKVVLRLTIPDDAEPGPVRLTLKSKVGNAVTERFSIRLRAPTLAKPKPDSFRRGAEYDVTVAGSNLEFLGQETKVVVDAPMTVKNLPASQEKGLVLKLTVPASTPPGPHTLTVETKDGKASTIFTVALSPPSATGAEPATVARGGKTEVTVRGSSLGGTTMAVLAVPDPALTVALRGVPGADAVVLEVSAGTGARFGPRTIVLLSPDGAAAANVEVVGRPPAGFAATPAGAVRGASAVVEISGENVPHDADARLVPPDPSISIEVAAPPAPASKRKVTLAPDAPPGPRTLVVTTADGVAATRFDVGLRVPALTAMTPAEVPPGADTEVGVEGKNIDGSAGAVLWSVAPADADVSVAQGASPGTIVVSVKAGARAGPRTIVARTAEGASAAVVSVAGSTPSAPIVRAVVPPRIARPGEVEVTVSGLSLASAGRPSAVTITGPGGESLPAEVLSASSSEITMRLKPDAKAATGAYVIAISTAEGAAAAVLAIEAKAPSIAAVKPDEAGRGPDVEVVVTGSGLANPDGTPPQVSLTTADGSAGVPCEVVSAADGRVRLKVSGLLAANPGPRLLVVRTTDGGVAVPFAIVAAPPSITSISPTTMGVPATVEIAVTGKNLLRPDRSPPTVGVTRVGSSSALTGTVMSASAERVTVRVITPPATPAGPHVLVIKTPDGDAAALFHVVAAAPPRISKIDLAVGARGGTIITVIRGSGLLGASQVVFSGEGVTVTLLSGGTDAELPLRITVDAAAAPGPRTFTVTAPGGPATAEGFTVK